MSILAAASIKFLHWPTIRLPKLPRSTLGEHVSNATEAYAQAASTAYLTALGLTSNQRSAKDHDY